MKQQKYWQWTLVPLSLLVVASFVCISKLYVTDLKDFQKTSPLPTDLEAEVTESFSGYIYGVNVKILGDFLLKVLHSQTWMSLSTALPTG